MSDRAMRPIYSSPTFCVQTILFYYILILYFTNGTKYSRMDKVKFVKDSLEKIWSDMVCLSRSYLFKFFKDCLPQILLGPFLNFCAICNAFNRSLKIASPYLFTISGSVLERGRGLSSMLILKQFPLISASTCFIDLMEIL